MLTARLWLAVNYFNRETGIDQAVGIAGHPYLHIHDDYCMGLCDGPTGPPSATCICNSAVKFAKTIYMMAAEQGDNRCVGAGTGPWWCAAGLEGTRNGGFYGNDDHMNVRAHTYYAQNDFFWCLQRDSNSQSPDPTRPAC